MDRALDHFLFAARIVPQFDEAGVFGCRALAFLKIVESHAHGDRNTFAADDAFAVAQCRDGIEETARAIEQLDEAGVTVGGLVVNRVLPASSPDPFLQSRHSQEVIYLDEIDRRFAKWARVRVPQLPSDVHGVTTLEALSAILIPQPELLRP